MQGQSQFFRHVPTPSSAQAFPPARGEHPSLGSRLNQEETRTGDKDKDKYYACLFAHIDLDMARSVPSKRGRKHDRHTPRRDSSLTRLSDGDQSVNAGLHDVQDPREPVACVRTKHVRDVQHGTSPTGRYPLVWSYRARHASRLRRFCDLEEVAGERRTHLTRAAMLKKLFSARCTPSLSFPTSRRNVNVSPSTFLTSPCARAIPVF